MLILTNFLCQAQNRYDIIISEIMADPSPPNSLPNNEWIELKNVSATPINLQNWRFADASSTSGVIGAFVLKPDSMVIICNTASLAIMSSYGPAISVSSFPSLDNDGDLITLRSASGKTIHAINFSNDWYENSLKEEGGWTLEMIDTRKACMGKENWKASSDPSGGSPGKKNSVDGQLIDNNNPQLIRAYAIDSFTIVLIFNETLDSVIASSSANYSSDGIINITSAVAIPPLFNTVQLKLNSPMQAGTVYSIKANNIKDCRNNSIGSANIARIAISSQPLKGDWVINEILFNPRSNAFDYVEFFNNSNKVIDVSKIFIANRNSSGTISSIKNLSSSPFLIFPKEIIVITENKSSLAREYLVKDPGLVFTISSLPSFPDDEGTVITINNQGIVIDEVNYKDDWHFALIDNAEGVSLERIDPAANSNDASNWHSASSTAGFGTPTQKNSQYKLIDAIKASIEINPKIFSPDNDGRDDITRIQYNLSEPGFIANVIVYDPAGRMIKRLVNNQTLGLQGYWNWDGLDDKGNKLSVGVYIVFTEIFNLRGKRETFKKALVLARSLK